MQSNVRRMMQIAATLFLVLGLASTAWAGGVPWQAGDVVVCYGHGMCRVVRITNNNTTATSLDTISDGKSGATYGGAIDGSLHLLVTDDGGNGSNIVKYSIPSLNFLNLPTPSTVAHTIVATFDGSVSSSGAGIRAVALDSAGHMFVGNSNPATIAEIDQNRPAGNGTNAFPSGWRAFTQYPLNFIIIDSIHNLQQVTTAGTSGSTPPSFSGTTGGTVPDPINPPQGTTSVVWTNIGPSNAALASFPVSSPTSVVVPSQWASSQCYGDSCSNPISVTKILDTNGHLQTMFSPGTSGSNHPLWNDAGGTTRDNAVIWTDEGSFTWNPTSPYTIPGNVVDSAAHVQKVFQAGTSGPETPPFTSTDSGISGIASNFPIAGQTTDGLTWTNMGPPPNPSIPPPLWQPGRFYPLTTSDNPTQVFDGTNVQQVTTPGTSTPAPATQPTSGWNSTQSERTFDNAVIWADHGGWKANIPYSQGAQVGSNFHLQQVVGATDGGTSGPGPNPPFAGAATTTDGLQWTDTGLPAFGTACVGNQLASLDLGTGTHPAVYFSSGGGLFNSVAQDAVVQKVTTPLSAAPSSCTIIADFGPHVTLSALKVVPAGAAQNPNDAVLVLAKGTIDVDSDITDADETTTPEQVYDVCKQPLLGDAISVSPTDSCALLIDTTSGTVIKSYAVDNSNLQALALDPLIDTTSCTGSATACAVNYTPSLTISSGNFWAGDGDSATFYRIPFGGGSPTPFTTIAPPCDGCKIQGMVVYAGEGANQAGLALLNSGTIVAQTPSQTTSNNSLSATFKNNVATTSLYTSQSSDSPATVSLYVSPVDNSTCFNDGIVQVVNSTTLSYSNNGLPCRQTTVTNNPGTLAGAGPALAWKMDIPTGVTTALPATETLSTSFKTLPLPGGNGTENNSTHAFLDMAFDTTVVVGNTDPTNKYPSVHSLHEVPFSTPGGGGCSNTSPVPRQCFQSPNTVPFKFACSNFPKASFGTLAPVLSMKQVITGESGNPINLFGTNGTNNYRFTGGQWVFNWNVDGFSGQFNACTFDNSGQVQGFCVPFTVAKSCK